MRKKEGGEQERDGQVQGEVKKRKKKKTKHRLDKIGPTTS